MPRPRHPDNPTAVWLLRAGEATPAELAAILQVPTCTVIYWAKAAGVDVVARRSERLHKRWLAVEGRLRRNGISEDGKGS